jgi:release factor family 10
MSLTRRELIDLVSSLHDRWTLSTYIDASASDPAVRGAWKTTLRHAIDATRTEAPRELHKQHERAVEQLEAWLETATIAAGQLHWYVFATEDAVVRAGELAAGAGTLVHWKRGAWILPFVSTLAERRPALVVLVDSRTAALHTYANGRLESRGTFRRTPHGGDAPHMGDAAALGFHGGTRGVTKHDAAERARLSATRRLLGEVTQAVSEAADGDAWIIIGGSRGLTAKLREHLPPRVRERTVILPELRRRAAHAAIVDAAERGIALLRWERDRALLDELLEHSGAHTNAVVGLVATLDAVQRGTAANVLLTPLFLSTHGDDAERVLEGTLAEGGHVHVLDGAPADELDANGGGIGATLRFVPAYAQAAAAG